MRTVLLTLLAIILSLMLKVSAENTLLPTDNRESENNVQISLLNSDASKLHEYNRTSNNLTEYDNYNMLNLLIKPTRLPDSLQGNDTLGFNVNDTSVQIKSINDSINQSDDFAQDIWISNSTEPERHLVDFCILRLKDESLRHRLAELLEDDETKLIEYNLEVMNQTWGVLGGMVAAGLEGQNSKWSYRGGRWTRVTNGYGQTIISLAFNYEVLSLMTLSYGIERFNIQLEEQPFGCLDNLTAEERRLVVLDIILRDFNSEGFIAVKEDVASVCQEIVEVVDGKAFFADHCCYLDSSINELICRTVLPNKWLRTLDVLVFLLVVAVYLFGVHFVPSWMYSSSLYTINYVVPLTESIHKKIVVCKDELSDQVRATHIIDLRNNSDFTSCRKVVENLPTDLIIPINVSQFNIKVNYRKLLTESYVPVSLMECLSKALFLCKLRELSAFKDCCDASLSGFCWTTKKHRSWISCCSVIGRILIVILLPIPFYIRLVLYYSFEHEEINSRHEAAATLGLPLHYNYRLLHYLSPTHPIFFVAYGLYFTIGAFLVAYRGRHETRFQAALVDSFADLRQMSWLLAMRMLVRNILYPFRKFGLFGFLLAPLMWVVLIPISTAICLLHCLPVVFLTSRIMYHILRQSSRAERKIVNPSFEPFEVENILRQFSRRTRRDKIVNTFNFYIDSGRLAANIFATIVSLLALYSVLLIFGEVAAYVGEIISFTMMGLIVNASKVIKYGSLIFLIVIYCIDTYSNVNKKYQKLNKALFSEIKSRVKGLEVLTSLPSYLQRCTGFKSSASSATGEHELPDDLNILKCQKLNQALDCKCKLLCLNCEGNHDELETFKHNWHINDLILFIDNEDTPRIPKKIFEDCCLIKVHGSPGPVYRSLLQASGRFVVIIIFLMFVFIVVMSFGDVYKVSSTNQMLATLAGGFMPFILSKLLKPVSSDVETNLLSYKTKLEEILDNFSQIWPMSDFIFNIDTSQNQHPESLGKSSTERTIVNNQNSLVKFYVDSNDDVNANNKETTVNQNDENGNLPNRSSMEKLTSIHPNGTNTEHFASEKRGTFCNDLTNPLVDTGDIEEVVNSLVLESAIGKTVDVAIIISEKYKKWDFTLSEASDSDSVRNYCGQTHSRTDSLLDAKSMEDFDTQV